MAIQRYTVQWQEAKLTLSAFLHQVMKLPWSQVKRRIENGGVKMSGHVIRDPAQRLKKGKIIELEIDGPGKKAKPPAAPEAKAKPAAQKNQGANALRSPMERYSGPRPEILFIDESIVVVDKPIGLTTNRSGDEKESTGGRERFLPVTLAEILPELIGRPRQARATGPPP